MKLNEIVQDEPMRFKFRQVVLIKRVEPFTIPRVFDELLKLYTSEKTTVLDREKASINNDEMIVNMSLGLNSDFNLDDWLKEVGPKAEIIFGREPINPFMSAYQTLPHKVELPRGGAEIWYQPQRWDNSLKSLKNLRVKSLYFATAAVTEPPRDCAVLFRLGLDYLHFSSAMNMNLINLFTIISKYIKDETEGTNQLIRAGYKDYL